MNGYCSKSMKSQNELPNVENEKSKRKTLNGCCQMCIKTVKMTQKFEKPQGEASMEAWSTKKWSWRECRLSSGGSLPMHT